MCVWIFTTRTVFVHKPTIHRQTHLSFMKSTACLDVYVYVNHDSERQKMRQCSSTVLNLTVPTRCITMETKKYMWTQENYALKNDKDGGLRAQFHYFTAFCFLNIIFLKTFLKSFLKTEKCEKQKTRKQLSPKDAFTLTSVWLIFVGKIQPFQ